MQTMKTSPTSYSKIVTCPLTKPKKPLGNSFQIRPIHHSYSLHQLPQPLDQLGLVVAVAPGPVEGRGGDHEARGPVPDEGHLGCNSIQS